MTLPFEITANGKTTRTNISSEGIIIQSTLPPQVDAKGFYLKKTTIL
jgi:hypothetical protein